MTGLGGDHTSNGTAASGTVPQRRRLVTVFDALETRLQRVPLAQARKLIAENRWRYRVTWIDEDPVCLKCGETLHPSSIRWCSWGCQQAALEERRQWD